MSDRARTWGALIGNLAVSGAVAAAAYLYGPALVEHLSTYTHPQDKLKQIQAKKLMLQAWRESGHVEEFPSLDNYENTILTDVVFPSQIKTTFEDIGGLEHIKQEIQETVILPLTHPELYSNSSLISAPKGVMFYGPPGTGKTMMAQAIAKSCKATFLYVRPSTLNNKWFGESQKLVRAVFTLAQKFSPTVIFIDEIDMFLRRRSGDDHEASTSIKSEFMQLWDGVLSGNSRITVLAATNRPFDIDEAVLRRLPRSFEFALPAGKERQQIVRVLLHEHTVEDGVIHEMAKRTHGYSGSDLFELCKYLVLIPVREKVRTNSTSPVRPITLADVEEALKQIKRSGHTANTYQRVYSSRQQTNHDEEPDSDVSVD